MWKDPESPKFGNYHIEVTSVTSSNFFFVNRRDTEELRNRTPGNTSEEIRVGPGSHRRGLLEGGDQDLPQTSLYPHVQHYI